jgi:hypothetical protein
MKREAVCCGCSGDCLACGDLNFDREWEHGFEKNNQGGSRRYEKASNLGQPEEEACR